MLTQNPTQVTTQQIIEALTQIHKIISDLGIGGNINIAGKQKAHEWPEYYSTSSIKEMFSCSTAKAQQIIRCIKSVSDSLGIRGKVSAADFEYWNAYIAAHGANELYE
jgi:hypothetical protein